MTCLYCRNSQAQSHGHFRSAEIFEIAQENDISIFFRKAGESDARSSTHLTSLVFDQGRVALIGNRQFRERARRELQEPRRGTFSPPLTGLIDSNLNQPSSETGFESKLCKVGECLEGSLLDDVLDLWVTAERCSDYA